MKRSLSFGDRRGTALVVLATALIAGTYGLVRLAYGLFLPDISASLGLGDATAGRISSGASIAYCVAAVGGLAAPRHPRLLVVAALATAAVGALAMAAAGGVPLFAAAAVLASAGAGFASPALVVVVERSIDPQWRGRAQATVNSGTGPGLVAAGLLALVLLPHWRAGLAIGALFTAAVGLGVLLLDRGGTPAPDAAPPASAAWVRRLLRPALAAVLLGAGSAAVWTYGRTLLVAEGASGRVSTLAWVTLGVGGTLTVLTARTLTAWPAARAWLLTAATTAAAVGTLGVAADAVVLAVVACAAFGWGFVAASSALIAAVGERVPGQVGPGTALLFVALTLGQSGGSWVAGVLAERHGTPAAFLVAAATAVAATVGLGSGRTSTPNRGTPGARVVETGRGGPGFR